MKSLSFSSFAVAALLGLAKAMPAPAPAPAALPPPSAAQCKAVKLVVDILKLQKATPYCSSVLGIRPTTSVSLAVVSETTVVPLTVTTGTVTSYTNTV